MTITVFVGNGKDDGVNVVEVVDAGAPDVVVATVVVAPTSLVVVEVLDEREASTWAPVPEQPASAATTPIPMNKGLSDALTAPPSAGGQSMSWCDCPGAITVAARSGFELGGNDEPTSTGGQPLSEIEDHRKVPNPVAAT